MKGFYALMMGDECRGIHYFNGIIFTERTAFGRWEEYKPLYKTPDEFNRKCNPSFTMEYLGE